MEKEYCVCPKCHNREENTILSQSIGDEDLYEHFCCSECGQEWHEHFKLSYQGYSIF